MRTTLRVTTLAVAVTIMAAMSVSPAAARVTPPVETGATVGARGGVGNSGPSLDVAPPDAVTDPTSVFS